MTIAPVELNPASSNATPTSPTWLMALLTVALDESPAFPCVCKMIRTQVHASRIGVANGITSLGYQLGPALGTLMGGLLMARLGWRPVFVLFGLLSLLWLVPWSRTHFKSDSNGREPKAPSKVGFQAILRQPALCGASIGSFGLNDSFHFILAWLPTYLVKARGFSMHVMTQIATPDYALSAVGGILGGLCIDRLVRRHPSTHVHKWLMLVGFATGLVCLGGMAPLPRIGSFVSLYVYEFCGGLDARCMYAAAQVFAVSAAVARWVSIKNTCGILPGLIAPAVTGMLVEHSGSYVSALVVAGPANALRFVGWVLVMPRVAPIPWVADPVAL